MGSYRNAMELLVEEEVDRQVRMLPSRAVSYMNRVELVAYALNQLPALYATSERGLEYQTQRGRVKFREQIIQAVQRALAAIRRDPIRTYAPLQSPHQSAPLREVLHQLRLLLKNDKVDWETLPKAVEKALQETQPEGVTWDARYEATPNIPPSPARKAPPMGRQTTHNLGLDLSIPSSPPSPPTTLSQPGSPPPPPPRRQALPTTPPVEPGEKPARRSSLARYEQPQGKQPLPEYGWDDPFYSN